MSKFPTRRFLDLVDKLAGFLGGCRKSPTSPFNSSKSGISFASVVRIDRHLRRRSDWRAPIRFMVVAFAALSGCTDGSSALTEPLSDSAVGSSGYLSAQQLFNSLPSFRASSGMTSRRFRAIGKKHTLPDGRIIETVFSPDRDGVPRGGSITIDGRSFHVRFDVTLANGTYRIDRSTVVGGSLSAGLSGTTTAASFDVQSALGCSIRRTSTDGLARELRSGYSFEETGAGGGCDADRRNLIAATAVASAAIYAVGVSCPWAGPGCGIAVTGALAAEVAVWATAANLHDCRCRENPSYPGCDDNENVLQ